MPQTVIVAGASGALGQGVVTALAAAGYRIFGTYHSAEDARAFEGGRGVTMVRADVTDAGDLARLFDAAAAAGTLHGAVNLVGGFAMGAIEETTKETFDAQVALNLGSTFMLTREAVRRMRAAGGGRIVHVGSRAGMDAPPKMAAYASTKAAISTLVRSVASECKGSGVTINAVLPGTIDTPRNRASMPKADPTRWVAPEAIGRVIAWLLSEDAAIVSGASIPVYGDS